MINIILCDDHELVRKGLRQLLQQQPGFLVLAEVASGEHLLKELRKAKPDVIILDIALPGRSGLEILKQVRLLEPQIKVLVLSMYPEDQFALRVIKAGASGYLHKDTRPEILHEAIRTVAAGGKYVSQKMTALLISELSLGKGEVPLFKYLSDREYDVMLMLAEGKKPGEIAATWSLSIKTISTYKSRIFEKLRLKNISELVRYVQAHNLLKNVTSPV